MRQLRKNLTWLMRRLFQTAFSKSHYIVTFIFTVVFSLLFTFSSQLEMFSLGVITKRGPDFFTLFGPMKDGKLTQSTTVSREELKKRFDELSQKTPGKVTQIDVEDFLVQHGDKGLIDKSLSFVNRRIPIEEHIGLLVAALLFVALFKAITLFCYRFGTQSLAISISKDLRQSFFDHIQKLPMSFYQQHNIGALSSRVVNDAEQIADGINSMLVNYLQTPFALVTTFSLCMLISWQLSCIVIFGFPLLVVPIIFLAKRIKRIAKQIQKKQEVFASILVEFLSGVQTIKIFAMENFSLAKYRQQNEEMAKLERKSARYDLSSRPVLHTIGIICLVAALLIGLYGLDLPLHEVLFFCGLLSTVYEPIKKFAEENARIQRGIAASDRMYEVMDVQPEIVDLDGAKELTGFFNEISFQNVSFQYDQQAILSDVSFTVKKGQKVAICGPTGAGKSTIVNLLVRLYDPNKGKILIDNVDIKDISQRSLRDTIAFVPQKPFLFYDTVFENVRFGRLYTFEEVKHACVLAHADEFIQKLPEQYNTILAEAGKSLSGGQQQRLAIGRALVKNAPILVMDEATSSLDAESEQKIKDALSSLRGTITQIIIAHRLSTIEDADKIIFIAHGIKIAEGTKDELLELCPQFKKMWDILTAKLN